ncbi:hypothetical protein [Agrococcus sp. TF02-05]|uniref:hypothetical protein n=1 Tax=Agrococcus sp. TF02-05 TaxID=2815211 RepID=UPI001AA12F29|nr:hypothetical protein [Agrococcus sp. TF02-05]MBO1770907.1 hypothetical protein [Agrococcus sp. TF02-05]
MRFRWQDGAVTLDGSPIGHPGDGFWSASMSLDLGGERWTYRTEPDWLVGTSGDARVRMERGRFLASGWGFDGPSGTGELQRTTNALLGRLHFDVHHAGERIGEIAPEGPWLYRPALTLERPLHHAEAVMLLWAASRIDARRPLRTIRSMSGISGGS